MDRTEFHTAMDSVLLFPRMKRKTLYSIFPASLPLHCRQQEKIKSFWWHDLWCLITWKREKSETIFWKKKKPKSRNKRKISVMFPNYLKHLLTLLWPTDHWVERFKQYQTYRVMRLGDLPCWLAFLNFKHCCFLQLISFDTSTWFVVKYVLHSTHDFL